MSLDGAERSCSGLNGENFSQAKKSIELSPRACLKNGHAPVVTVTGAPKERA